ncbi:PAAR domain-containing protein [Hyphomonas sp.]|uniref:PAAR domain-containing protein n=1 Tax=Hyphomonas sp. TaxID=87 RepID=UPI0026831323|tara:strand:+ start:2446 stop:2715 length:270 start_codon:yes stop_codon:yes gene_type:complete
MSLPLGRVGDFVGAPILSSLVNTVTANGQPVAVIGSPITPHDEDPVHIAVVSTGSTTVTVGGIGVTRLGSVASCGHPQTSGSSTVTVGS